MLSRSSGRMDLLVCSKSVSMIGLDRPKAPWHRHHSCRTPHFVGAQPSAWMHLRKQAAAATGLCELQARIYHALTEVGF